MRESGTPAGLTGKGTGLRRFEGLPPWVGSAGLSVFLLWFSQQTRSLFRAKQAPLLQQFQNIFARCLCPVLQGSMSSKNAPAPRHVKAWRPAAGQFIRIKAEENPPGRVAKKYFLCYTKCEYRPSAIFYKNNRKLREKHFSGIWDAAFDIAHRFYVGCQSYGVHDSDVLQMDASSIVGKIKDTMTWDTARDFCSLKPSK